MAAVVPPRAAGGPPANDGLDAAKIAAIVLMAANHVLLASPAPWPEWGYVIGRPCVPLFTVIMVGRLAAGGAERARRMLVWLAVAAVLSQPVYYALTANWPLRANVLVALAAGVALIELLRREYYVLLAAGIVLLLAADPWLDPGATAPVGMVAAYAVWPRSRAAGVAILCALAAIGDVFTAPQFPFAALAVLAAPVILIASPPLASITPRLPRWTFYVFYPAHLLAIWLVYGPYR